MTDGLMEPLGDPTFLGMTGYEVHALWYGFLDQWGRFRPSEIDQDEKDHLREKRHYFMAGKLAGGCLQAIADAGVIYLTTHSAEGAVISALVLVAGHSVTRNNNIP